MSGAKSNAKTIKGSRRKSTPCPEDHLKRDTDPQASTHRAEDREPAGAWGSIVLLADMVNDFERVRIANENRLRSLVSTEDWGKGAPTSEAALVVASIEGLKTLETSAVRTMEKAMKKQHPLGRWVAETKGLGLKTCARFLAIVGDPAWHIVHDRPRRLGELWAYCKFHVLSSDAIAKNQINRDGEKSIPLSGNQPCHDEGSNAQNADEHQVRVGVAPRRRKGVKSNWNAEANTRAYLLAESCMKCRTSAFRHVYDKRREHTKTTHPDWTDGHSHNDALRITAKAIVKAMWIEARRIRGLSTTPPVRPKQPNNPTAAIEASNRRTKPKNP